MALAEKCPSPTSISTEIYWRNKFANIWFWEKQKYATFGLTQMAPCNTNKTRWGWGRQWPAQLNFYTATTRDQFERLLAASSHRTREISKACQTQNVFKMLDRGRRGILHDDNVCLFQTGLVCADVWQEAVCGNVCPATPRPCECVAASVRAAAPITLSCSKPNRKWDSLNFAKRVSLIMLRAKNMGVGTVRKKENMVFSLQTFSVVLRFVRWPGAFLCAKRASREDTKPTKSDKGKWKSNFRKSIAHKKWERNWEVMMEVLDLLKGSILSWTFWYWWVKSDVFEQMI